MGLMTTALLCISIALGLNAAPARADARAQCHQTVDRILALKPPVVTSPKCNPVDPACAAISQANKKIRDIQTTTNERTPARQLKPECKPIVTHRCDAYTTLMERGRSDDDAWKCAMSDCSNSRETAAYGLIDCICRGEPELSNCNSPAETPPLPHEDIPQATAASSLKP